MAGLGGVWVKLYAVPVRRARFAAAAELDAAVALGHLRRCMRPLKLLSWNVNGIRACARKGMRNWLQQQAPDIVCVQEVRALPEQWPDLGAGWQVYRAPAEKKGYSGVAIMSRQPADEVQRLLAPQFDREGRMLLARFGRLLVCSAYFPKGDGPNRDMSRLPYKFAFYRALLAALRNWRRRGLRVVCAGDFNTARSPIDLARPAANKNNSGFRSDERQVLEEWFDAGFVDTFRAFDKRPEMYTWWSQRQGVRARNVGWRIDYVLASRAAMRFVTGASIQSQVLGSDHCPVGITLDRSIVER